MEEKETKSEMIKRLATESNENRLSKASEERLKEAKLHREYEQLRFSENLEEMAKTIRPLADSMSDLVLQSKFTLKEITITAQVSRDRLEKAWNDSYSAAERIQKAAKGITWRMWVAVILVGSLSGPATLLTYDLYQKYFSTEKVAVKPSRNAR